MLITTSNTREGVQYALRYENGAWGCTCPGYAYRGSCRHSKALESFTPLDRDNKEVEPSKQMQGTQ